VTFVADRLKVVQQCLGCGDGVVADADLLMPPGLRELMLRRERGCAHDGEATARARCPAGEEIVMGPVVSGSVNRGLCGEDAGGCCLQLGQADASS
jgi:hypothetical protein